MRATCSAGSHARSVARPLRAGAPGTAWNGAPRAWQAARPIPRASQHRRLANRHPMCAERINPRPACLTTPSIVMPLSSPLRAHHQGVNCGVPFSICRAKCVKQSGLVLHCAAFKDVYSARCAYGLLPAE